MYANGRGMPRDDAVAVRWWLMQVIAYDVFATGKHAYVVLRGPKLARTV